MRKATAMREIGKSENLMRESVKKGLINNYQVPHPFQNAVMYYEERSVNGTTTLTVPAGKVWYPIASHTVEGGADDLLVNDISVLEGGPGGTDEFAHNYFYYDTLLKAGDTIKLTRAGADTIWVRYLELEEDGEITPVPSQLIKLNTTYTVPESKMLVIRRLTFGGALILVVDDKNYFSGEAFPFWRDIALFIDSGRVVKTNWDFANSYFWGYLITQ